MKLNTFKNYQDYAHAQETMNKVKLDYVWVDEHELESICTLFQKQKKTIKNGICHGVRNGWEVIFFREKLKADVFGTEISETAKNYPHMIQWDFHKIKPEWIHNFDFIYSNSLDHSYNPQLCLEQWMRCLDRKGLCFIHWAPDHGADVMDKADCFGANEKEYQELLTKKYVLVDKLVTKTKKRCSAIFVIGHSPESYQMDRTTTSQDDWTNEEYTLWHRFWFSRWVQRGLKLFGLNND